MNLYVVIAHPSLARDLHFTPRQRWKWEHHQQRYARRYGKPEELPKGEIGFLEGVSFRENREK